jgi:hypothetical protein
MERRAPKSVIEKRADRPCRSGEASSLAGCEP